MNNNGVIVKLDPDDYIKVIRDNKFGLFLAQEWKRIISPYTPHRYGMLEDTAIVRPWVIEYIQPYAHYIYEGEKYVDPKYNVGGFTSDGGETFFSRPGIAKIPSGIPLNYSKETNPYATDHWDNAAINARQDEKLAKAAQKYIDKEIK